MTTTDIITNFELQVNDVTELSSAEELALLNRVYRKICNDRPWEFLRATTSPTVLSDATGSYIALPSDFGYFMPNTYWRSNSPVGTVYLGSTSQPYQIVDWNDRLQYAGRSGIIYLDRANNYLRFTAAPNYTTTTLDYIKTPTALTAGATPILPAQFHDIFVYGMAAENDILQLSDKARSYMAENKAAYNEWLADMALWDSQFKI